MPKARGVILHDFVIKKIREDPRCAHVALKAVFEQVGASLAEFHERYRNKQHSDFQVANIIYNEASQRISFIDTANMGCPLNPSGSDVNQFKATIQAIYAHHGRSLAAALEQHFVRGYSRRP
jgi:tRNA A-37 threonylcarbamoyl transferase component Bud32